MPEVALGDHLSQDTEHLDSQLVDGAEAVGGIGRAGLGDQAVERIVLLEQRRRVHARQTRHVLGLVAPELHHADEQGPADRVDVGGDAGPDLRHLRRLIADGAVDGGLVVVDPADATHVDELHPVADLDQVVRFEVAVDQAEIVQVRERRKHFQDVGECLVDRQRIVRTARRPHPVLEDLLERGAADVLHHDVAGLIVSDEVVDLHDQGMLDLGQELALDDGHRQRVRVAGVQQALQDDPAVGDVLVPRQVDPTQTAVGQAAGHLVLVGHEVTRLELRCEGEAVTAFRAEALGAARAPVSGATHR